MAKKKKNIIDIQGAIQLFNAYGIITRIVNHYHIKLRLEESSATFDWYHTTGSLVMNRNNYFKSMGNYTDPENIATMMLKRDL